MKLKLSCLLIATALASMTAQAVVTTQMIDNDAASTGDVLTNGMGTQGQRYSTLKKINASNIGSLAPAWSFSFGGEKQRGQESQPVVHNGKMFITSSYSRIYALDAATGKKLWKYEYRLPEGIMPCCDVINRGAALFDNLVIYATLDANLVALNQDTGEVVWKEKIDEYTAGYSMSAAPLIAGGLLLTGVSGGEFGIIGRVEARDPKTGKLVWVRPTVEGHMGKKYDKDGNATDNGISGTVNKSWPGDLWKTGGAAPWLGGTYNAKTGLAYFGTGNPAPWNSHIRQGDNLFSCSTVAIDVKTGQIVWHYQGTPNDGWDFDGVNEFVTYEDGGKILGGKADRNGFFYVNDATTGKLINAFPFVKKISWATGIDLKTGRPNFRSMPVAGRISCLKTARATRPPARTERRARPLSPRLASSVARTRCRWPTARIPSCSMCLRTNGAWRSGTSRSPSRRVRPTWAQASRSRRSTTTTSARCVRSIRRPARSFGKPRTSHRCGVA
jgi:alcohol dehydrogenase (cytochrome c)